MKDVTKKPPCYTSACPANCSQRQKPTDCPFKFLDEPYDAHTADRLIAKLNPYRDIHYTEKKKELNQQVDLLENEIKWEKSRLAALQEKKVKVLREMKTLDDNYQNGMEL